MMTRLQFLRSLAGLGLAAVAVPALAACKKDDDAPTPDAGGNMNNPDASMGGPVDAGVDTMQPQTCGMTSATIGTNHGHAITVPAADVAAGVEKTYPIQGTSMHPHTVRLTAANFATLKQTGTLTVSSSNDGHAHSVTITCS
jgi:hypothetical protein